MASPSVFAQTVRGQAVGTRLVKVEALIEVPSDKAEVAAALDGLMRERTWPVLYVVVSEADVHAVIGSLTSNGEVN